MRQRTARRPRAARRLHVRIAARHTTRVPRSAGHCSDAASATSAGRATAANRQRSSPRAALRRRSCRVTSRAAWRGRAVRAHPSHARRPRGAEQPASVHRSAAPQAGAPRPLRSGCPSSQRGNERAPPPDAPRNRDDGGGGGGVRTPRRRAPNARGEPRERTDPHVLRHRRAHRRRRLEHGAPRQSPRSPRERRDRSRNGAARRAARRSARNATPGDAWARAAGGSDEQSVGAPDAHARSPHAKRSAGAAAVAVAG